jgi:sulfite reductase (NADPH) hemoprotein beta-component
LGGLEAGCHLKKHIKTMYTYNAFDQAFVQQRAAQYRHQLERNLRGELSDEEFRPLRLQNGWYIQRHAPMLRIAVPYGVISSTQLRALARIARDYDRGYAHATTRQNFQFNWIALKDSADVMDVLASVGMHGIQTSGNCVRNITTDAFAGIAPDESIDPRPWCEIIRQWSTLHPEFAHLPRKFKIAVSGAAEDRAAVAWHDVGLHLVNNAAGELGFRVLAGGGMGRTPIAAPEIRAFVPWQQVLNYLDAVLRVYNQFGRRDNMYKARIKILVKAEGQNFIDAVEAEFAASVAQGSALHTLTDAQVHSVAQHFQKRPSLEPSKQNAPEPSKEWTSSAINTEAKYLNEQAHSKWLQRNVHGHKDQGFKAVTLSLKRVGQAPGDVTDAQMDKAADLADAFSAGELRVTHDQNLVLPWVREAELKTVWAAALAAGFATPNIGLLTDMIACPGGDFCALANARSLPIAQAITERYQDLDELWDIGDIDLHISGCINSCGHHHSGHIGILGVDKDGQEWYQVTLGGADGSTLSGAATPGKVVGPSFSAEEVPDVIEAVLDAYRAQRSGAERFIETLKRVGADTFKQAANAARRPVAASSVAVAEEV